MRRYTRDLGLSRPRGVCFDVPRRWPDSTSDASAPRNDPGDLPAHLDDDLGLRPGFPAKPKLLRHIRHPLPVHMDGALLEETPRRAPGVLIGKCTHHQIPRAECTRLELDRGQIARQLPARKLLLEFFLSEVRVR